MSTSVSAAADVPVEAQWTSLPAAAVVAPEPDAGGLPGHGRRTRRHHVAPAHRPRNVGARGGRGHLHARGHVGAGVAWTPPPGPDAPHPAVRGGMETDLAGPRRVAPVVRSRAHRSHRGG